ncbi:MAG: hypothetical protein V1777_00060 [Candidatus Micrarchaeota archaeon]
MLWYQRDGILFALVVTPFQDFEGMTKAVQKAIHDAKRKPLLVVFPAMVFGTKVIEREKTEQWIQSVFPSLQSHGNTHLFFSVLENPNPNQKEPVLETGYLVGPNVRTAAGKKRPWMRYNRITKADNPPSAIMRFRGFKKVPDETLLIGKKTVPVHSFPRLVLNNRRIELRACFDASIQSRRQSDIIVIPAWGLRLGPKALQNQLRENGFALVHDILGNVPRTTIVEAGKNPEAIQLPRKIPRPKISGPQRRFRPH